MWSPHTYGPSQHDRVEFHNAAFPANMQDVWEAHWGQLVASKGPSTPAVVLGEWGGPVSGDNGEWMNGGGPHDTWEKLLLQQIYSCTV